MHRVVEMTVAAGLACLLAGSAQAQAKKPAAPEAPKAATAAPSAAPAPAAPGWVTRCTADARQGPLDCVVEENAVMNNTGQLVVGFSVRVPSDTRAPVVLVRLPLGLYLPAGLKLQVDDGQPVSYPLQTCDGAGCYVGTPLDAGLLARMKTGKQLKTTFQNLQRNDVSVQLPLTGFAESYAKIQ
ncbi:invasion associated locus B family protein [Labrys neptuniae]